MSKLQHNQQPFLYIGSTGEGESITLTGQEFQQFKWVQGISGSGKSTFLAWIALSLLRLGITVMLLDPHGDLARLILNLLAATDFFSSPNSVEHLYFVDFARQDGAIPFNVLRQEQTDNYKVASNFLEAIHRAFPTSTGTTASLDNTITYAAFVLAENGLPITQLQRFLLDKAYRDILLAKITDQQIIQFFDFKFADKVNTQLIDSTMRRLDLLTFSPTLRRSLGQRENKLNFRNLMDNRVSCLISLGGLAESEKRLLGCLLLVSIEQAFLSRLTLPPEKRSAVHLLVDEAPLFVSQSEAAFTTMLEQCRKAGAVLLFANQTITQLPKGIMGSLQQALPIMMKAGSSDSSELASRFYRPTPQERHFDFFGLKRSSPGVFDSVKTIQEARMIFESLKRQEAIVMLPERAVKIKTPTLPVKIDQKKLDAIEALYAKRLLTPSAAIERNLTASNLILVSPAPLSTTPLAKRRVASSHAVDREPLQLLTGVLDADILTTLYHFHYLTLSQIAKLLDREKSINHVRSKLKNLVEDALIETTPLARASAGKPPTVYFLTARGIKSVADTMGVPARLPAGEKKHGYLDHSLECSDMLIASVLLSRINPSITLVDLKHERTLKNTPCKLADGVYLVPDGWVHLRLKNESVGICFEVDRNTEDREKIQQKIHNYVTFASGSYQQLFGIESLTIAFCVTDGAQKRVKQLLTWAEQALQNKRHAASLFLFGSVTPGALDPESFFLDATFLTPYENTLYALVETP